MLPQDCAKALACSSRFVVEVEPDGFWRVARGLDGLWDLRFFGLALRAVADPFSLDFVIEKYPAVTPCFFNEPSASFQV